MIEPVRDRRTFVELRATGTRVRQGPLGATYLRADGEVTRVAYAITRRVGGSVARNRLRRRLRAILADLDRTGRGGLPRGVLVVSAGPAALDRNPRELRNDVQRLMATIEARQDGEGAR